MKRKIIKLLMLVSVPLFMSTGILLYLAVSPVKSKDVGTFGYKAKMFSKSTLMSFYDSYKNFSVEDYGSNPLDEDYVLENLNHPYYEDIRNDERLKVFYEKDIFKLEDYILMREYLRDLFPHGTSSKNYLNTNLIEMLNAAEKGEKFLCGQISKMLCQMIMASGTHARVVGISNAKGSGHVVVEYWSKDLDKWVLLDPDYNVHYTSSDSIPLNGLELFQLSKSENKSVLKHKGASSNTLFSAKTKLYENFYRNGVAVDFYNQWASKNYKRKNPVRSPINSCIYVGSLPNSQRYYKYDYPIDDNSIIDMLYANPFDYELGGGE